MTPFRQAARPLLLILSLAVAMAGEGDGLITLEQLAHPSRRVAFIETPRPDLRWLPDGTLAEVVTGQGLTTWWRSDPPTGRRSPLIDPVALARAAQVAGATASQAAELPRGILQWNGDATCALARAGGDLWRIDVAHGTVLRLTDDGADKREPLLSPDGTRLAFVRGNDLFVVDALTRRQTRLTWDGGEDVFNGVNDWVYWEEVHRRHVWRAFWWSPDGQRLAFLRFDERRVPVFTIIDDRFQPQRLLRAHYPKVGDPLPTVRLGVVDMAGITTWMEDPYPGAESIIGNVSWSPDGRVIASYLDRPQGWLELRRFTGTASTVLLREQTAGWQSILPPPRWLPDGGFLWESDRSGHRHLYRHDADGRPLNAVTAGGWQVRNVHGVAKDGGTVFFDANERSPIGIDTYRVSIDGSGMTRLGRQPRGSHAVSWDPAFTCYLDTWSSLDDPPRLTLCDAQGAPLRAITEPVATRTKGLRLGTIRLQQVPTRDGFPMETLVVLPVDCEPGRKYPVMQEIYGGPGLPTVRDAWTDNVWWWQFLAQRGYITWICDNRSACAKDVASVRSVHRRVGALELQDQLDGLAWLGRQGWADMAHVGITGSSYGGFMTAYALTHSTAYRLGVAGSLVTDHRLYDCIYAERLMDLLDRNREGYDASSLLRSAGTLSGHLVLYHGAVDDNVHFQNTVQFIEALQHAGRDVELRYLPGAAHGLRDGWQQWCQRQMLWRAISERL